MRQMLAAAALAVLTTMVGASVQAVELFQFEFRTGGPFHIGTDSHTHHNDFRHHDDYYITDGYLNPYQHTECREFHARDGSRRIVCKGKPSGSSVPGR